MISFGGLGPPLQPRRLLAMAKDGLGELAQKLKLARSLRRPRQLAHGLGLPPEGQRCLFLADFRLPEARLYRGYVIVEAVPLSFIHRRRWVPSKYPRRLWPRDLPIPPLAAPSSVLFIELLPDFLVSGSILSKYELLDGLRVQVGVVWVRSILLDQLLLHHCVESRLEGIGLLG